MSRAQMVASALLTRLISSYVCKTCGGKLKTGMRDGQPWIVCAKDQTHNGIVSEEKYKARKQ